MSIVKAAHINDRTMLAADLTAYERKPCDASPTHIAKGQTFVREPRAWQPPFLADRGASARRRAKAPLGAARGR